MKIRIAASLLALFVPTANFQVVAQNAPGEMTKDSMALMSLAHDKNGLTGSDVKPWHIRGTYHSYDPTGKSEHEGTYEEWWISATKYKLSFTNPKFTQTDYADGTNLLREGAQEWLSGPELLLRASLLEPLPEISQLKEFTLQQRVQPVGQSSLNCVSLTYPINPALNVQGDYPTACFESTLPVLRIFAEGAKHRTIYEHIASFQGHYLSRQVQVFVGGKLSADLNLDVVELLKASSEGILVAPASASRIDLTKITFEAGGFRWPAVLKKTVPLYPTEAKRAHIEGTVHAKCTIGVDGHVENVQIVDGPGMLRSAALDADRQWIYRPFEIMGQPRPVQTKIVSVFGMQ